MSDITERLRALVTTQDHERGCEGRQYSCTCGHDARVDAAIAEAADEIERLRAALREIVRANYWVGIEHGCPYIEWDNGDPEDIARAALANPHD